MTASVSPNGLMRCLPREPLLSLDLFCGGRAALQGCVKECSRKPALALGNLGFRTWYSHQSWEAITQLLPTVRQCDAVPGGDFSHSLRESLESFVYCVSLFPSW